MLSLLTALFLSCLVVAGIAITFRPEAGKRLLTGGIILLLSLVILGPIAVCLLNSLLGSAAAAASRTPAPSGGGTVLFLFLLVLVVVAVVRFVLHRRKLRHLLGERPTSLKRRLDSEGA